MFLSRITTDHAESGTYEGGPSSLITSKCIMGLESLLLVELDQGNWSSRVDME